MASIRQLHPYSHFVGGKAVRVEISRICPGESWNLRIKSNEGNPTKAWGTLSWQDRDRLEALLERFTGVIHLDGCRELLLQFPVHGKPTNDGLLYLGTTVAMYLLDGQGSIHDIARVFQRAARTDPAIEEIVALTA